MFGAEELRRGCVTDRQTDRHSGITVEGEVSGSCCTRYGLPLLLCFGSETVRTASYGSGGRTGLGRAADGCVVTSLFQVARKGKVKLYSGTP